MIFRGVKIYSIKAKPTGNVPLGLKKKLSFLSNSRRVLSLRLFKKGRSVRLTVRTPDFHSGNRGSIPLRTTEGDKSEEILVCRSFFAGKYLIALRLTRSLY